MKRLVLNILFIILLSACSTDLPQGVDPPSPFNLLLPENEEICEPGENINGPLANVLFNWKEAQGATSYNLEVVNASTFQKETFEDILKPPFEKELVRGEEYRWKVFANNSLYTVESMETFIFYLRGDPISNYTVLPPQVIYPKSGESISGSLSDIELQWVGSDWDSDELFYRIIVEYSSSPNGDYITLIDISDLQETKYKIDITPSTYYTWTIVVSDGQDSADTTINFTTTPN